MHIIVLGGAGAMGRITVRTLTEYGDVDRITIADYHEGRARELAASLASSKVEAVQVDVNDEARLRGLLHGANVALSAVDYVYNLPILRACVAEKVHYADLGGLFHMTRKLMALHEEVEAAGITAILGMGGTPGITNLLARAAADQLDRVESMKVELGCSDSTPSTAPLVAPYSIRTILDEFTKEPQVFQDGEWHSQRPLSGQEEMIFPLPVGRATAIFSLHSECATFPVSFRDRGIRYVSFKIAFPSDFMTKLKFLVDLGFGSDEPLNIRGGKVSPREMLARLLEMAPARRCRAAGLRRVARHHRRRGKGPARRDQEPGHRDAISALECERGRPRHRRSARHRRAHARHRRNHPPGRARPGAMRPRRTVFPRTREIRYALHRNTHCDYLVSEYTWDILL